MQNVDLTLTFILEGGMQRELNSSKSNSHFSRSAQVLRFSLFSSACVLKKHLSSASVHSACRPVHALDTQNACKHIQMQVLRNGRDIFIISISHQLAADDFEMALLRQNSASDRMLSDPYSLI
jgi:hypothetical protein